MSTSAAALLEDALRQIAGADALPTSITIDYGAVGTVEGQAGGVPPLTTRAWVERATKSLIFAQAEARTEQGTMFAVASGVFRRVMSV